jgi:hypothetical protein
MKEGAAINKSLLTLGTVINKLSEGTQAAGECGWSGWLSGWCCWCNCLGPHALRTAAIVMTPLDPAHWCLPACLSLPAHPALLQGGTSRTATPS